MSLFRSDKMGYYNIIGSWEYSWEILNTLGEIDCLQFVDLNTHEATFNRPFSNYVRRCEDLENKINTLYTYLRRFDINPYHCEEPRAFLTNLKYTLATRGKDERTYLDDVESEVNGRISSLNDQIKNYEDLLENYDHLVEYRQVLKLTRPYVGGGMANVPESDYSAGGFRRDIQFTYLAGVIDKEDSLRFRRILFRITRGMTWTALIDMERPNEFFNNAGANNIGDNDKKEDKPKTAFIIVYQGGEHGMLKEKLRRVCESFGASQYGVPESSTAFDRKLYEIEGQLNDAQEVVKNTKKHIDTILLELTRPSREGFDYSHLEGLRLFIVKEKVLYHNLNMLAPQQALFRGNCWCPIDRVPEVEGALQNLVRTKSGMGGYEFHETNPPAGVSPPTGFRTNEFTHYFQEIVNTYGVPRYREINPGLFTIATFPFLFGVMFGDIAHGGLLFIAGIYLCWWKPRIEKDKDSIWNMVLPGRYLLLLQGLFAFYAGWIYNDFGSIPLRALNTCYDRDHPDPVTGEILKAAGCTYEFGIDPNWYHTSNELTFLNSFKMKLSIILGVTQMIFGILLRGLNSTFTKKWLDFFFEFIPMLIFMSLTFGYMCFLIVVKWTLPWNDNKNDDYYVGKAPSIISIFIKMVLSPGSWDESTTALYGDVHGGLQARVQLVFLLIVLVCGLLILFPKPIIIYCQQKKHTKQAHPHEYSMTANLLEHSNIEDNQMLIENTTPGQRKVTVAGDDHAEEEHHDMGEIVVHQVIETIEFILGSVSNTASYLRLWALSLAHSQLAKVFYDKTIAGSIEGGNPIGAFIGYWLFANITLGVLLLMDQMECFLHALRLHWVEFQSKFYKADGYSFVPFSFERSLRDAKPGN